MVPSFCAKNFTTCVPCKAAWALHVGSKFSSHDWTFLDPSGIRNLKWITLTIKANTGNCLSYSTPSLAKLYWQQSESALVLHLPSALTKGFHVSEPCWPLTQLPNPSQRNLHWIPQVKSNPAPTDCTAEKLEIQRCACDFFTLFYMIKQKTYSRSHSCFSAVCSCLTLIKWLFPIRHWANADPYWVTRPQRF